jgi:hypothetical protein
MIHVDKIDAATWTRTFSENAHRIAFGKLKPHQWDRLDFALVVASGDTPMGYLTCREMDHETIYWQFGGAFPGTKDTVMTWQGYQAFVSWCALQKYKRITTYIENSNVPMLKMAMKVGFRIHGVRSYQGAILLEHIKELHDAA